MNSKKILARVLMGLNGLVILGLLLLGGLLLYFSNAQTPTLLGTRAMLRDTGAGNQLVLYHPGEPPLPGGQVLIRTADGAVTLGQEAQIDADGLLVCVSPSGESLSLALTAPEYLGRVTGVSDFWGELFARIAAPNQLAITYVAIAIGFLLCVLLLAIIYLTTSRRSPASQEKEDGDEEKEEPLVPKESPAGTAWGQRKPLGAPRTVPDRQERVNPFQQTPLSRPFAAPPPEPTAPAEEVKVFRSHESEEEVKVFHPHESEEEDGALSQTANRYAAPHILRTEAGRDAPAPPAPVRSSPVPIPEWSARAAPVPSDETPARQAAPPAAPRREPEIVIRERAGDPYDLYDVGPSISELLQELDKLQ